MSEETTPQTEVPVSTGEVSKDEKTWGMLSHLSVFVGLVIPFGNIIAPLVIWLMKKDEENMSFVEDQAKEVLNFQIATTIYAIVGFILMFVVIGVFILGALAVFWLIVTIIGALKANEGVAYRYPMSIRLIN